jgi:hypothetical protein
MDEADDKEDDEEDDGADVSTTAFNSCPPGTFALISPESGELMCAGGGGDDRRA